MKDVSETKRITLSPSQDPDFDFKKFNKDRLDKIRRDVDNFHRAKRKEIQKMKRAYYDETIQKA